MASELFIKFMRKGFHGERLKSLPSDGHRWRWWRLYCLSDQEVFPGLVSKGLTPLTDLSIAGELYDSSEFKDKEKVALWRAERDCLHKSGLIDIGEVNGNEFVWNVNFHSFQDKYTKRGVQLRDKFYTAFLKLNERDKTVFIVLLSKFKPKDVDLDVFSIPKHISQIEAYANKQLPLFSKGSHEDPIAIKSLLMKIDDCVRAFEIKQKTERGNCDVKGFMEWYCERFKNETKRPYTVGGKDFKLVAEMLKLFSMDELKKLCERFFREPDQYVKRAGYTVGIFKTTINRLVSTNERRPIGLDDYSRYRG